MITCAQISEFSAGGFLVDWQSEDGSNQGYGLIDGFADGSDAFSIDLAGDTEVKFKASGDGKSGTISFNDRSDGVMTLKLNAGSPHLSRLRNIFLNQRGRRGPLALTSSTSGESYNFGCAGIQKMPVFQGGSEAPDSIDVMFWFSSLDYTPPRGAQQ